MKCIMRFHKTQLPSLRLFTDAASLKLAPYIEAGYRNFDMMLVGGGGGRAGNARSYDGKSYSYGAGGGGAGSLRVQGLITDLPLILDISVGHEGGVGGDASSGKAYDGGPGGNTTVAGYAAYGGQGATGGSVTATSFTPTSHIDPSKGGWGGLNSANLGQPGEGGHGRTFEKYPYPYSDPQISGSDTAAGNGTWVDGSPVLSGGAGGGGGRGRIQTDPALKLPDMGWSATGAQGSAGNPQTVTFAQGSDGNNGGRGGGVNLLPVLGYDAHYGGAYSPNGAVAIRFS